MTSNPNKELENKNKYKYKYVMSWGVFLLGRKK